MGALRKGGHFEGLATPMTSRLSLAAPAIRTALKGRMLLSGPPGSGKTRSSLILATELAEGTPILGIDTEKESMATYADDFEFEHLRWMPPYDPRELAGTITEAAGKFGVVIVDSLSHFWRAEGGTLDIANGKFTGWNQARPVQEALVEAIVSAPAHMLLAVRAKIEYAQEQEANGKHVVRKLGMASVQDDTLEYEVNVAVDIAMDHTCTISKTRCTTLPVGRAFRAGQAHELGVMYREWLAAGEKVLTKEQIDGLVALFNTVEDPDKRKEVKLSFVEEFGKMETVAASRLDEATAWAKSATGGPIGKTSDEATAAGAPTDIAVDPVERDAGAPLALDAMTGRQMSDALRERGLDPSGSKAALRDRLATAMANDPHQPSDELDEDEDDR